jgi:DNA-binding MarR family transcriptional regulator
VTENERRARYYKLTNAGRAQLRAESAALLDQFDAMATVLNARTVKP